MTVEMVVMMVVSFDVCYNRAFYNAILINGFVFISKLRIIEKRETHVSKLRIIEKRETHADLP